MQSPTPAIAKAARQLPLPPPAPSLMRVAAIPTRRKTDDHPWIGTIRRARKGARILPFRVERQEDSIALTFRRSNEEVMGSATELISKVDDLPDPVRRAQSAKASVSRDYYQVTDERHARIGVLAVPCGGGHDIHAAPEETSNRMATVRR